MEWKTVKLGDITIGGKGSYGIGAPAVDFNPLKYTYLRITDINDDGTINYAGLKSVDDPEAYKYILKPNDIVFARTGATTGRTYFYLPQDGTFVYAGFLIKFSIDPKKANPRLLKYITHSQEYYDWVRSFDTGGTRGNINAKTFADMPLCLPDRATQDKIVAILSSLDDKIENNNRINRNLEAQAQALFKSWFVDFEPWGGVMPEDWKEGKLGDIIAEIESGSRPKGGAETSGVPSIGAEKIERFGTYDYGNEKFVSIDFFNKMKRGHVKDGDVMLYKDGAYTGKSSMALDGFPYKKCAVNEHVFLLRTKDSKYQFFLYCTIAQDDVRSMIYTLASAKAAQPGLNTGEILGVEVIIPSEGKMARFNNLVAEIMHTIATNSIESQRLAQLRDTLLPKLMKGEIEL